MTVRVHPAKDRRHTGRGPLCDRAKSWGFRIEWCGGTDWAGWVSDHLLLGESEDAYESAEDCAEAGMRALLVRLADDVGFEVVERRAT